MYIRSGALRGPCVAASTGRAKHDSTRYSMSVLQLCFLFTGRAKHDSTRYSMSVLQLCFLSLFAQIALLELLVA